MKKLFVVFLLLFLISFGATASEIKDLSKRIEDVYGVSVLPPQEKGWSVMQKGKTQLVLAKKGPTENSTYIAPITIFKLPKIRTEQQFLEYISKMKEAQQPKERFKVIQDNHEFIPGGTNHIIKYHKIVEDKVATTKFGNKTMLMEIIGYTFQHPKNYSVGVDLGFSYRYHIGAEDKELSDKANAFLDQIKLVDLK